MVDAARQKRLLGANLKLPIEERARSALLQIGRALRKAMCVRLPTRLSAGVRRLRARRVLQHQNGFYRATDRI